jgi:hypothetical protein
MPFFAAERPTLHQYLLTERPFEHAIPSQGKKMKCWPKDDLAGRSIREGERRGMARNCRGMRCFLCFLCAGAIPLFPVIDIFCVFQISANRGDYAVGPVGTD